jgi:hypothetical protein
MLLGIAATSTHWLVEDIVCVMNGTGGVKEDIGNSNVKRWV